MIQPGQVVDNKTLYESFGVANSGGMRRSLKNFWIVLIADWTKKGVRNRWDGDVLHYTGQGSGNQKLEKQNKNVANSRSTTEAIHLFEVHKLGEYTYVGEVELAAEPYQEEQTDSSGSARTVWMFPLRRNVAKREPSIVNRPKPKPGLPLGVYAVVADGFDLTLAPKVHELFDRLKDLGLSVLDKRDIEAQRIEKAEGRWYDQVLTYMRRRVKDIVEEEKRRARVVNRTWSYKPDELELTINSTEGEIQEVLDVIGRGDEFHRIREEALAAYDQPGVEARDQTPEQFSEDAFREARSKIKRIR